MAEQPEDAGPGKRLAVWRVAAYRLRGGRPEYAHHIEGTNRDSLVVGREREMPAPHARLQAAESKYRAAGVT